MLRFMNSRPSQEFTALKGDDVYAAMSPLVTRALSRMEALAPQTVSNAIYDAEPLHRGVSIFASVNSSLEFCEDSKC